MINKYHNRTPNFYRKSRTFFTPSYRLFTVTHCTLSKLRAKSYKLIMNIDALNLIACRVFGNLLIGYFSKMRALTIIIKKIPDHRSAAMEIVESSATRRHLAEATEVFKICCQLKKFK